MIPYGRQHIDQNDVAAVAAALQSPYLTQGPRIAEFEARLAECVGAKFAVACANGTAALHAAYAAAGIGPGRTVVTSPITFVATANSSLYLGGSVEFADVEADSAQISVDALRKVTAGAGSVVAPVHFAGSAANMPAIARLAADRGWTVVEDAAHALGAEYRDEAGTTFKVGSCAHSSMCCFSFHPVKHITTAEGGAVTTNDATLAARMRQFRTHGITRDSAAMRGPVDGPWYYEQQQLGFNYRLTDVQSALGLSQLAKLDGFVARRRELVALYHRLLAGMPNVRVLREPEYSRGSFHLFVVLVPGARRRAVFDAMVASGVGVNVHYIPVYRQPYYRDAGFASSCPGADAYYAGALSLPMFPDLRDEDVHHVVESLAAATR